MEGWREEGERFGGCNSILIQDARNPNNLHSIGILSGPLNVIFGLRLMWVVCHTQAHTQTNLNERVRLQSVTAIYRCEANAHMQSEVLKDGGGQRRANCLNMLYTCGKSLSLPPSVHSYSIMAEH